jgi:hypothetical protein
MELALVLRELWSRKRLLVVGVVISGLAAWYSLNAVISVFPPRSQARSLQYSAASATAFVDWSTSFVGNSYQNIDPLVQRAMIYANLIASPSMVELIGEYAHIPGDQIAATGPEDPNVNRAQTEPTAEKRNVQITGESMPYKLNAFVDPNLPVITFYSQAPSGAQAIALANGAVRALSQYVAEFGQRIPPVARIVVRQVGEPTAAVVDGGIRKKLAGAVFVAALVAWCSLVLIAIRLSAYWRAAGLVARRTGPASASRNAGSLDSLEDWMPEPTEESSLEPEPTRW